MSSERFLRQNAKQNECEAAVCGHICKKSVPEYFFEVPQIRHANFKKAEMKAVSLVPLKVLYFRYMQNEINTKQEKTLSRFTLCKFH